MVFQLRQPAFLSIQNIVFISFFTVNRTDTETVMFCYLRVSSSPRCFRPKRARLLCIFNFFLLYIKFITFYVLCKSSA